MEKTASSNSSHSSEEKATGGGHFDPLKVFGLPPDPDRHRTAAAKAALDRQLVFKLDVKLMPWLCILYLLSFLDRTNIGNAKIDGLQKDLDYMSDGMYNACLTVFFVSYALAEPFTNVMLKRLRPSIFIPIIMVLWGSCMLLMGFVYNWSGLMAARWFLGLTEAGLFPGVNYYLSCWYKRSEFGVRAAIFFSAAAVSGSFGGLLAAAINLMDGVGGLHGWAWIFIVEGIVTVLFGIASFWIIIDFPDEAKFLDADNRSRVVRRLMADQQSSASYEEFDTSCFPAAMRDYKMWLGMLIYMGCDMPLYAFSLFLPTIITSMGYTNTTAAQLLTVPPYACAAILTIFIGWFADRTRQRGLCNICVSCIGIAGFAITLVCQDPHTRYAGTFLGALGIYPCIANTITWVSNNIEGVYKRGVVLGCVIGWGNLNGIVSSNIYRSSNGPHFLPGHVTVMVYMTFCLLGGSIMMRTLLARENKLRLAGKRDHWVRGMTRKEAQKLGDRRPDFLYTL